MTNSHVRRVMLGFVGVFVLACIAIMSFGERSQRVTLHGDVNGNMNDNSVLAASLLRRGMIDAASNRFERAKRAFDAAKRAAKNDAELIARIDKEAMKLDAVSKRGEAR